MVKQFFFVLAVVVLGLLVAVEVQPSHYSAARTARIAASPARIFALIDDFHEWEKWSPWVGIDPRMQTTYAGPPRGVGASYRWAGNDDVGEGRMRIIESHPDERIVIDLEFLKPFASKALLTFSITAEGSNASSVLWEMSGDSNFMTKAMSLLGSMDGAIGADFEKGLRQMKTAAESAGR